MEKVRMGHDKKENIVKTWYNNLSKIKSIEIQNLIQATGCPNLELPLWDNIDDAVVNTIISQMLSAKAANSIINKIYSNFNSSNDLLNHINKSKLDKPLLGISIKKQKSLLFWANSIVRKNFKNLNINNYNDVEDLFINVWGLGKWSVDMLSIFYFCIPNVWPTSDLGIMKYSNSNFNGEKPSSITGLETITSLCIWHGIDNNNF